MTVDFPEIARALPDPLWLLTAQGRILAANPAAGKLLRVDAGTLTEQNLQDLTAPDQLQMLKRYLRNWAASRQALPASLTFRLADGEWLECLCHGSLLRPRSADTPALIILRSGEKSSLTGGFVALNEKIAQLEKEIAGRRQFEKALTESELQVRLLLDSAGEGLYGIDLEGRCSFVNAACLRLLGYDHNDELLGRNMHELIHHTKVDGSPFPVASCEIYQSYKTGQHFKVNDEVFWRRDGSSFPVEYFAHPVRREGEIVGAVVTFEDITERKEIEAELARSQETLELAQAISHIGSWDWNILNGDLSWSDEIYRIFGLEAQAFGATYEAFLETIHANDRDAVVRAVSDAVIGGGPPYDIQHRVVRPDGSVRIVSERGKVYRDALGQAVRMIGSVQDITEQKQAEEKIRKLNEELEERVAQRTAELRAVNKDLQTSVWQLKETQAQLVQAEKLSSLGGLVAGVAHEINTPVGVGVTAITHLQMKLEKYNTRYQSGQLTRDDFEALLNAATESSQIIHTNLNRAAELISSFKQVAVDQVSNELRSFRLRQYLHEVVQSLKPKLKSRAHTIDINCPDDIELSNYPGALSQVLTNLIMNSVIHGFENRKNGRIKINVSKRPEGGVRLVYSDNGKGMPGEYVNKIFEPFFTTRRGQGGSGLGMHIVFNLVTQTMAGRIECQSVEGEGIVFNILLPAVIEVPQAAPRQGAG